MKKTLKIALNKSPFSNFELASLYEIYGFACALSGDGRAAQRALDSLKGNVDYSYSPETIKLAYLCHDYSFIFENFREIYMEWVVEATDYMIVHQTFKKAYSKCWESFDAWVKEDICCFYAENPEIEPDLELFKTINFNECVPNVKPIASPVFSCDFYD